MKPFYTMQEIQLFPGMLPSMVKRMCQEIGIQRVKREIPGTKASFTVTRKELERLLRKAGWEAVEINGEKYWIKGKIKDF